MSSVHKSIAHRQPAVPKNSDFSRYFPDSEYLIGPPEPVFRAHVRKDANGTVLYRIDDADLEEIARNTANTIPLSFPRQTIGHILTDPEAKETDQPPLVGFWLDPQVQYLGELGVHCITMRPAIKREYAEKVKQFPFRSAEYRPQSRVIRGVARLLRDPALDLGIQNYQDDGETVIYSLGVTTMPEEMKPEGQPSAPPEMMTPEEEAQADKLYRYMCKKYTWMGDAVKKYEEASASVATSTNTQPPVIREEEEEPEQMQSREQIEQYQRQVEQIKQERDAIADRLARTEVGRILDQLEVTEHYQLDRVEEEARMLPLDDVGRAKRISEIRKFHAKKVGGSQQQIQLYQGAVEPGTVDAVPHQIAERAAAIMAQRHIPYREALQAAKSGG